jgi:hypothetical protein
MPDIRPKKLIAVLSDFKIEPVSPLISAIISPFFIEDPS